MRVREVWLGYFCQSSIIYEKYSLIFDYHDYLDKDSPIELAVMSKFNGKSREDLIKMVVLQQNTIDLQGKKITDLESYIDTLLSQVIEVAPVLLHKDVKNGNRFANEIYNNKL